MLSSVTGTAGSEDDSEDDELYASLSKSDPKFAALEKDIGGELLVVWRRPLFF